MSVGVGVGGIGRAAKIRIGAAFATAEVFMNSLGALLGSVVGSAVGDVAAYFGFLALVAVGIYTIVEAIREHEERFDLSRGFGLLLASLSISLDSLGIGFSIVYIGVPIVVTLVTIAVSSIVATTLGLALGRRFGAAAGERAAMLAGVVLVCTGLAFAGLKYFHKG